MILRCLGIVKTRDPVAHRVRLYRCRHNGWAPASSTFEGNQHVFGCRLPKGDQRLIFRRSIPRVQGGHIRKLNDHDALRLPYGVILFQDYMAAGLSDVAPAVFRDDGADLGPVLLELCWISNRVLSNDVSWHSSLR